MRLSALATDLPHRWTGPSSDPEISFLTHDSRRAAPGALFAAFPGVVHDGLRFLPDAIARGASATLGREESPEPPTVPHLMVPNPRLAAGVLSARLAGNPCDRLVMVGITGTSGKTTTSLLLDAVLAERHECRGLFGTLVYRGARGVSVEASRTTPEATELQPMLASLVEGGGTAAVMECSSHALALDRLAGCRLDAAVFLNLSRDHLDFHRDLDDYFHAKAGLFDLLKDTGKAVVNVGDAYGERLFGRLPSDKRVSFRLSVSGELESRGGASVADVTGVATLRGNHTRIAVENRSTGESFEVSSPLLGRPNAENLLAAAATAGALGLPADAIVRALASVERIPGRLELVPNSLGFTVLVDYAHKPGALEGVLLTARSLAASSSGRVVVVFGCGGDRDRGKRPEMGRIAATLADVVVVTSDNPRSEDPEAIVSEIRGGVEAEGKSASYIVDRRAAIEAALAEARRGDVLVIAGKGHETYQETAGRKEPFDDREVALSLLSGLLARNAS
jgi:UDP-N-acetylmuramoyl-L-alanyl-D-glutamate--2,6-diaminopimelate ligase